MARWHLIWHSPSIPSPGSAISACCIVVVRVQCGAAGDRSGNEERSAAFGGAAAGTGASQQVGNLSRTRTAYSHCEAGCAIAIRASIATRTGEKPSRLYRGEAHHCNGFGAFLWSHLHTRTFTTGPVCHCRAGREPRGDPGFH